MPLEDLLRIREREGYATSFDTPGRVAVTDRLLRSPDLFAKVDGVWTATLKCVECRAEIRFPLEGDGYDVSMLSPAVVRVMQRPRCEKCILEHEKAEDTRGRRERASQTIKRSGIPQGLAAVASWDTLISRGETDPETEQRELAIESCRLWARERHPKRGVLLYGTPGSGKTRLAATAAMARLAIAPVTWVSVAQLMASLQASWDDDDRKRALLVLRGKGDLVLDDIEKLNDRSPFVMSALFAAVDAREQAGASMIVTSNASLSKLQELLGEPIVSRLGGLCNVRPYPGVDLRLELS